VGSFLGRRGVAGQAVPAVALGYRGLPPDLITEKHPWGSGSCITSPCPTTAWWTSPHIARPSTRKIAGA